MTDIDKAYHKVFRDMMLHGPQMFKGVCDTRAKETDKFMYGIQTVMEYIAIRDSEDTYEQFTNMFTRNLVESEKKEER